MWHYTNHASSSFYCLVLSLPTSVSLSLCTCTSIFLSLPLYFTLPPPLSLPSSTPLLPPFRLSSIPSISLTSAPSQSRLSHVKLTHATTYLLFTLANNTTRLILQHHLAFKTQKQSLQPTHVLHYNIHHYTQRGGVRDANIQLYKGALSLT